MHICHPFALELKLYPGEIVIEFSSSDELRPPIGHTVIQLHDPTLLPFQTGMKPRLASNTLSSICEG
jgi:hypothetical protein